MQNCTEVRTFAGSKKFSFFIIKKFKATLFINISAPTEIFFYI
nr:MAG TPA: hypothetical protein [Caudoviricetes sp.]